MLWVGKRGEFLHSPGQKLESPFVRGGGLTWDPRRTALEKQVAADVMTPESLKARHLLALGRRESK